MLILFLGSSLFVPWNGISRPIEEPASCSPHSLIVLVPPWNIDQGHHSSDCLWSSSCGGIFSIFLVFAVFMLILLFFFFLIFDAIYDGSVFNAAVYIGSLIQLVTYVVFNNTFCVHQWDFKTQTNRRNCWSCHSSCLVAHHANVGPDPLNITFSFLSTNCRIFTS